MAAAHIRPYANLPGHPPHQRLKLRVEANAANGTVMAIELAALHVAQGHNLNDHVTVKEHE